eukprot:SAG11_NODE_3035_length_2748_cov_3.895432_4_plen_359_part_00
MKFRPKHIPGLAAASLQSLLPTLMLLASSAAAKPSPTLGPGRGSWVLEKPEPYGFPSATLELVAQRVQSSMAERYCLLIAYEGHLIHETYFRNGSETRYEADSLAKTMTAQIVGVAVAQGLVDLDKPLAEYGVEPRCADGNAEEAAMERNYGRPNASCAALLRRLCPSYAPPWDASGRHRCHLCGEFANAHACTSGCLRDEAVAGRLRAANCTRSAARWCRPPNAGRGCWLDSRTGEDYWPAVTARHLLSQTTGLGNYRPGTKFTYDSDQYIDHLAYLISKVANESSLSWATRNYALPMGLPPDIFAYSGFVDPLDGDEFSPVRSAQRAPRRCTSLPALPLPEPAADGRAGAGRAGAR